MKYNRHVVKKVTHPNSTFLHWIPPCLVSIPTKLVDGDGFVCALPIKANHMGLLSIAHYYIIKRRAKKLQAGKKKTHNYVINNKRRYIYSIEEVCLCFN